jgi:hypothetical protein
MTYEAIENELITQRQVMANKSPKFLIRIISVALHKST